MIHFSYFFTFYCRTTGRAASKYRLKAVRRLKSEKPTKRLPTQRRWRIIRISKGPFAWLRCAKEIRFWQSRVSFKFQQFFFCLLNVSTRRSPDRVLFRDARIPAIWFTCHSYILTYLNQIYSANVSQQHVRSAFHFILKIGHALNRSLLHSQ